MKSTVEQINPVQYRVNVEVSPEEVNVAFEAAYRSIQKKARIQGFRPGKAPLGMIRKLYGPNVAGEVHEKLINQHLFNALGEQQVRPIASPVVEANSLPNEGNGYQFSAIVDTMPTIEITDYKGVAVNAETYSVKDETIARELDMIRRRQARTRPAEPGQPASKGMVAQLSHTATHDGKPVPGMDVTGLSVALGEGELYEGLENEVLGMTVGQTKTAKVKLPDTYGDADLAGKELEFSIALKDLNHLDLPALDDELAKDLSFESLDKLKGEVQSHLEARAKDMSRQKVETAVLDKILASHPFEVPPAMVDQVIDSMISDMGFETDDQRKKALRDKDLRQRLLDTAKKRTQNTLLLWHVTQKEQLQVTDEDVKNRVEQAIQSTGLTDPKQTARLRQNIEPRVRENLIFEKAMDFLIDNAQVTAIPRDL